jgi:hypothetical protein
MKSDQGSAQSITHILHRWLGKLVLEFAGKAVSLPLEMTADSVHGNTDDSFERGEDHLEKVRSVCRYCSEEKIVADLEKKESDDRWRVRGDLFWEIE